MTRDEKHFTEDHGASTPNHKKSKHTKKQFVPSSSEGSSTEEESDAPEPRTRGAQSSKGTPPKERPHEWNRRGTNAYQRMKTCQLCGLREIFKYKDQQTIRSWVPIDKRTRTRSTTDIELTAHEHQVWSEEAHTRRDSATYQ